MMKRLLISYISLINIILGESDPEFRDWSLASSTGVCKNNSESASANSSRNIQNYKPYYKNCIKYAQYPIGKGSNTAYCHVASDASEKEVVSAIIETAISIRSGMSKWMPEMYEIRLYSFEHKAVSRYITCPKRMIRLEDTVRSIFSGRNTKSIDDLINYVFGDVLTESSYLEISKLPNVSFIPVEEPEDEVSGYSALPISGAGLEKLLSTTFKSDDCIVRSLTKETRENIDHSSNKDSSFNREKDNEKESEFDYLYNINNLEKESRSLNAIQYKTDLTMFLALGWNAFRFVVATTHENLNQKLLNLNFMIFRNFPGLVQAFSDFSLFSMWVLLMYCVGFGLLGTRNWIRSMREFW